MYLYRFSLSWNLHSKTSIGRLPSWRNDEFDIFVAWFSFTKLISAGFETSYLSLLTKLSKSHLKLHQFISVGVYANDGLFLSKNYSVGNKSLLLKLIMFWFEHVVLASAIILLSFSRYNNFHWLLWCLHLEFLNLVFFHG